MANYEKSYHLEKHSYLYNNEEYYLARARVAKHDYFYTLLDKSNFKKVLDFGCGLGQNIYKIHNSVGYDISEFALEFCRKKRIKVTNDLGELQNKSFDVVFSCDALEHLENPLKALKQMKKKLAPWGHLVLILPIEEWKKVNLNDKNQHLYGWNYQTITNLLSRAGFHPICYKIIKRTGFKKLLPFCRINFRLYLFLTKLLAMTTGSKRMRIVAVKK